jgi:RNA polymerase sigma-70 factor (ECF subfamily)
VVEGVSDESLAGRAAGGDQDAFAELVRRHQDRLYTLAYRVLWNEQDATDCVQDALFSAWRAINRFRGDAKVSTWLHQIVVRKAYDLSASRKRHPTAELDPEAVVSAARPAGEDERIDLLNAIRMLDADFRVVVVACDVMGMSLLEAAEALGIPEGTVKSRRSRGLARIQSTLAAATP